MKAQLFILFFFFAFVGISQNQPPVVTATGNQAYCPLSQIPIVTDFNISDPDGTTLDAFFIQISSGYQINVDQLILTGNHPTIISSWSATEGKLTLRGFAGSQIVLSDVENAVKDIVYMSSSENITSEKTFSLTAGDANFLPSTGHYYQYIPSIGITWSAAKVLAENSTYFGLQGYLATVTTADEAQITGEQASGAGWIGGSDSEQEGVWKWVTGPETGTIFWNGAVNGSSPNFAFWNTNEPNNFNGNEDYAHITDPSIGISGSWNDLTNTGEVSGVYQPKGYVVEYGGLAGDPAINISASTQIFVPQITTNTQNEICESESITLTATTTGGTISWYNSPTGGVLLATGNSFTTPILNTTTTYYVSNQCTTRIPVRVSVIQKPTITTNNDLLCSAGMATLTANASQGDVLWYNSLTSTTPLFTGTTFNVAITQSTTFYAEAVNGSCVSDRVAAEAIIDNTVPEFEVAPPPPLCLDQNSLNIEATNLASNDYRFEWKNEQGEIVSNLASVQITEAGKYFVTATSIAGCTSDRKEIEVTASSKAIITPEAFIISDETSNNSIRINTQALGVGDYEFSLDFINGNYTSEVFIDQISVGIHTLYIRDKNGCGTSVFEFSVLNYPLFFTPNGDSINQFWTLDGFSKEFYQQTNVLIFNRFGKIVHKMNPDNLVWDGTYKGTPLPSTSYWFHIELIDKNGRKIQRTGSFSLLRK